MCLNDFVFIGTGHWAISTGSKVPKSLYTEFGSYYK